jgi:hypothetical protein
MVLRSSNFYVLCVRCPGFNSQFGTFSSVGPFVHLSKLCDGSWKGVTAVSLHMLPIWFKSHFPNFSWFEQPLAAQSVLSIEAPRSHSPRHTTLGRTPLYEWLARRRDLYLSTHNTRKKQTSMVPAGFERAPLASDRTQTHGLDLTANGIGTFPF